MRKKIATYGIGVLFLICPTLAFADSVIPFQPTQEQLLAREVTQKAIEGEVSVACAVKTSKSTVAVNEPFTVWWASFGADLQQNGLAVGGWTPSGTQAIVVGARGVYQYKFTFFGKGPAAATCFANVSVL